MESRTTLLSYQMSYETRLFILMTESQQMGDYVMGCTYGIALLDLLGIDDLPQKPMGGKDSKEVLVAWQKYYENILMSIVGRVKSNVAAVRSQYRKDDDIPTLRKQRVVA